MRRANNDKKEKDALFLRLTLVQLAAAVFFVDQKRRRMGAAYSG